MHALRRWQRRWQHTFSTLIENSKPQLVWKIMCWPSRACHGLIYMASRRGSRIRNGNGNGHGIGHGHGQGNGSGMWWTYILRHGRVMGYTSAPIHVHLRSRYVNCFALGCIEFPNVGSLRGIGINFAGHLDSLMPARAIGETLARSANRSNCKETKRRASFSIAWLSA